MLTGKAETHDTGSRSASNGTEGNSKNGSASSAGGGGGSTEGGGGELTAAGMATNAFMENPMALRKTNAANSDEGVARCPPPPPLASSRETQALADEPQPVVVHYFASFHHICVITALLPLATLFTCFVTAYVFQYDDVHETHCRVYNIVPSISAITGISPQRYFWRLSIALHLGPRIPIAFIYKNYYQSQLQALLREQQATGQQQKGVGPNTSWLIAIILLLNCIEVASLGGVTYISNRENYPLHEKIFITFMICSLFHMLATIKLNNILHGDAKQLSQQQRESIKWKRILFAMSILSTIGLLIFFAKHRFYCHDLAFSWFAFFEYLIAIANMLFHFTIVWDFPSQYMLVVQGSRENLEEIFRSQRKAKLN